MHPTGKGIMEVESKSDLELEGSPEKDARTAKENQYPSLTKFVNVILALYFAVFLVALDQTIIGVAVPKITDQFKSIEDIAWYGSAYFLTSTALQPSYGRIMPLPKRPLVFGMFGMVWRIASIAGPLLGGAFTDGVTWRWCFYMNLPIGGLSIAVIVFILQVPSKSGFSGTPTLQRIKQLDLVGASLLIPAIVCLLLALQWGGNKYPWSNPRVIGFFVGFGLIIIIFNVSQIKLGDRATLPPGILKRRSVLAASMFALFFGGAFFLLVYYVAIFFQSVRGSSAMTSGIQLLPLMLATVMSSVLVGGFVTAAVMFFQTLGGALSIAVGQSVFQNGLMDGIRDYVPSVDPGAIVGAGATEIRRVLETLGSWTGLMP
ncbi:hypothetical protein BDV28DRAFT_151062 [Aspergillus coremiiformis]|uniref:Major facilitator superfamily domain-containing protein n=1 Tax=Aspergillus coremiiformis TaxID=138285 RepID=A0A5N6YXZ8_9EURO|nr:hypothetical protein BDV28DRAFT_151062 [Aspergillus coremiiformis]